MRLTELSTRLRQQCEIERESAELYRHQVNGEGLGEVDGPA